MAGRVGRHLRFHREVQWPQHELLIHVQLGSVLHVDCWSHANRLIYIIYIWLRVGAQCGATGTVGSYAEWLDQLRLLSLSRFPRIWPRKR
jgi:hypothetical protein